MRTLCLRGGWIVTLGALGAAGACGERSNDGHAQAVTAGSGSGARAGGTSSSQAGMSASGAAATGGAGGGATAGSENGVGAGGREDTASGGASGQSGAGASTSDGAASTNGAGGKTSGTGSSDGLSDFEIEPNPNMSISCFVSWSTAQPASSEVDFGEGDYEFRIRDEALVTDHRVLVIGMHAETKYKIRALSSNAERTLSAEGNFTTGSLPADIPVPKLTADVPARSQVGWTLTNVEFGRTTPAKVVMYDDRGLPVWYFVHGTHDDSRGDVPTELVENHVLVGAAINEPAHEVDLSGKVLWSGPEQSQKTFQTHSFAKTRPGNYLFNIELDKAVQNEATRVDDQLLEELTPELDVVWSWKLLDHVPAAGTREELCHGNSLKLDAAERAAYYNCRYLGLFKLDRASGDIVWRLGGTYDDASLGPGDFTYDPPESQFSDAHEPEVHDDGTVLLYDNGGLSLSSTANYHSRVLEYRLDESKKTATRVFEFPGDFDVDAWYKTSWYTPIWGDADRLANGNILVTAGMRSTTLSTRIFELTRAGEVVWELTFPPNYGSYQAQRLSPPPLVERIP
jgi:hypothetical protein